MVKTDCMVFLIAVLSVARLTSSFSIGDSAKNAYPSNPSNTVFDAKRLIGRKLNDPDVKRDIKHWPFKVSEKNGKPAISVRHKGEQRDFVSICDFAR
jgi:molecular chaperone DnaK (HSP70)